MLFSSVGPQRDQLDGTSVDETWSGSWTGSEAYPDESTSAPPSLIFAKFDFPKCCGILLNFAKLNFQSLGFPSLM